MIAHRIVFVASLAAVAFGALRSQGAEENAAPSLIKPTAVAGEFTDLVKQLDADQFADRQAASSELAKAGADAIPALIEASGSKSRETATRAVKILKQHFESDVEALKQAAKAALEKVAAGDNPVAVRQAKEALDPPKPAPAVPGGIQVFGGPIQIQIQAGGNGRNVRTRIINGVKEIEAEENGRKVKITEDPNNGIKIEIVEKKGGKETTKKVEAKDADDLKKKDPEAHKIYEEYSKRGGAIQIRGIQLQPGRALPIQPGQIRRLALPRIAGARKAAEGIEKAGEQIDEAIEKIKQAIENNNDADEIKQALEQLEQVKKQLEEAKEKLGG